MTPDDEKSVTAAEMIRDSQPDQKPAPQRISPAQAYYVLRRRQKQRLGIIPRGN